MTQEQKAKAYDEAFNRAKSWYTDAQIDFKKSLETLFPELKCDDEKIRKEIIKCVKNYGPSSANPQLFKNMLAWLEKQGKQKASYTTIVETGDGGINALVTRELPTDGCDDEHKPTDKVKPKFKIGEWITNGDYTWKIVDVKILDYILQSQDGNIVDDTISHVDEQFHSFTIQDAKDGDVLLFEGNYNSIVLFQGIGINGKGRINYHCKCDLGNYSFSAQGNVACLGTIEEDAEHYHPATKEQRDTLIKAMTDAGWGFDFEKKELKKIEQKSQRMVSAEAKEALYDKPTDEEMKELLRTEYEKGRADVLRCIDPDEMVADFCSQPLSKTRSLASIYRQGIIDIIKRINNNEETSITGTRSINDCGM